MCISACFMRRAGIPCESVVFDSQQDHNCKLLDSSFFQTSSAHHGSSPQSDLYVIHSCDKALISTYNFIDYSNCYVIIILMLALFNNNKKWYNAIKSS
ncbi:conserved hypothetical protein [Trichinella spiralis]|uniref:hypothetical protein n=1 Tax=Trichinella spiralis TaxID=6334 RepID=UPI0001EFB6A0|nr:conserved hypothetical protein [Trichinella spiralis]